MSQEKADKLKKVRCYRCKKVGHFESKCTKSKSSQASAETANAASGSSSGFAFMAASGGACAGREWIVDSSASSHINGQLDNLHNVETLQEPIRITVASGEDLLAKAKGDVQLQEDG